MNRRSQQRREVVTTLASVFAHYAKSMQNGLIGISVDCAIFGFDENELKVLLIKSDLKQYQEKWSLLGDLVHKDENLDQAAYRILRERTGMDDVYLEQVKSFGDVKRHPAARVVTVVYCSLINIQQHRLQKDDNELHWHKLSPDMDCLLYTSPSPRDS